MTSDESKSAKAGLHLSIKKTKILTTGEIYQLNIDNQEQLKLLNILSWFSHQFE